MSDRELPPSKEQAMSLRVALDFADRPRPHHTLQAPADTNSELYAALRVLASAVRAAQVHTADQCSAHEPPAVLAHDAPDPIRVLLDLIEGKCPACGGTDLHSASIDGRDGVTCCECPWGIAHATLRSDALLSIRPTQPPRVCEWSEIEEGSGVYNTCKAGEEFHLTEGLELYPYCQWCGGKIAVEANDAAR